MNTHVGARSRTNAPTFVEGVTAGRGFLALAVVGLADLKVTAVSMITPASVNAGVTFNISAVADVHNNGGFGPVNADAALTLSMPADCSTVSANPAIADNLPLAVSATIPVPANWSVTCTASRSVTSLCRRASILPDSPAQVFCIARASVRPLS